MRLYRARNRVERFFNKIKHYMRIATRYDKTAESFLAALRRVVVRIWLRDHESASHVAPFGRVHARQEWYAAKRVFDDEQLQRPRKARLDAGPL